MNNIAKILREREKTLFSFEVLPPVRGNSIEQVLETCEKLMQFEPAFVEVTNHRTDYFYKPNEDGKTYRRVEEKMRPYTAHVANAVKEKFGVPVVSHLICSGNSQEDNEKELHELDFLGIHNLLVLRGDRSIFDNHFIPKEGGFSHASELCELVNRHPGFHYGVAGYPEKHEEAMTLNLDMEYLKKKVDLGAEYIVTQMFFDNRKYFDFVDRCMKEGISIPIVPGLKPLATMTNLQMIPRNFHLDFPEELARKLQRCRENVDVRKVGIEWCIKQCEELRKANVPSLHFFTMNYANLTTEVMKGLL